MHRDRLLRKPFDLHHEAFFVQADQADGLAAGARAAGATDAVHVVFRHVGNFIVDDMRQVINIDTASSNVGGDQGADVAALEAGQCLRACALALVAVQRHRVDAVFGQELCHVVGAEFGAGKNQHLAPVVLVDDVHQYLLLLSAAYRVDHLRNTLHCGVAGGDLNALRVFQQRRGQLTNLIAEGGREQQALLVLGYQCKDFFHIVNESHVKHAVSFVQDQYLHSGQIQKALLLQVEQTARSGHQNVDAALDAIDLRVHAHTAKNDRGVEVEVLAVLAHRFFNLGREFAGRRQHQSANALAAEFVFRSGLTREAV